MFACESIRHEDYFNIINKKINTREFNFIDYEVKPLSKKSGIFGEHYILKLNIQTNGKRDELKYFLKTLPQVESQRNFTLEMGAFFKEEQMFKLLVPLFSDTNINLMAACAPKCYFSQTNKMIIFEDLSSKGYKCLNPRESFDVQLVKLTIDTMVKLHASGLILEERMSARNGSNWRLYDKFPEEFQEMLYCNRKPSLALIAACDKGTATQIDYIVNWDAKINMDKFKQFTSKAINDLTQYVKPDQKHRNAICHGDLWAANIMFKFNKDKPVDCMLVDFQSYRYCPPAQDLMTFLYLATDRAFREKHMQEVLDYYYEQLKNDLMQHDVEAEAIVSYKQFMTSCEDSKLFAVIQSVTHFQIVMMSPEGMAEFLSEPESNRICMFEDRSETIVKMCEKDAFYKMKQTESIMDLVELYKAKYC